MTHYQRREEIDFKNIDLRKIILLMGENTPGALRVVMQILCTAPVVLVHLDDMNIRGAQIWVGYKDVCAERLDVFLKRICSRDANMVAFINNEISKMPNAYPRHKAVCYVGRGQRGLLPWRGM